MKHCVILKLKPGADVEAAQLRISKTLDRLDDELDWLNRPVTYRACMKLECGADILAEIDLDGEERLSEYLTHPLTEALAKALEPDIEDEITFDHY